MEKEVGKKMVEFVYTDAPVEEGEWLDEGRYRVMTPGCDRVWFESSDFGQAVSFMRPGDVLMVRKTQVNKQWCFFGTEDSIRGGTKQ